MHVITSNWNTFHLRSCPKEIVAETQTPGNTEEVTEAVPKRKKRTASKAVATNEKDEDIVPGRTIVPFDTTVA